MNFTCTPAELNEYFQQFGRVTSRVTFDTKTGLSRKFGFISVANKETVNKIVSIENHYLEGNYVSVPFKEIECCEEEIDFRRH